MKHIYVINPSAGGGNAEKKYLPQILSLVKRQGIDYELHRTLSAADTSAWVRHRASSGERMRFYAVGGDGTVNDVISGLIDYETAELAVIPCGTGNDFVRNWTASKNNFDLAALTKAEALKVDVIKYGDAYSVNMLNIGADSEVAAKAAELKKRYSGSLAYLIGALKIIPKLPSYRMSYSADGGEEHTGEFLLVCIGNGKYCGGGFKSCPEASLTDGKMDVCLVKAIKASEALSLLLTYRSGRHVGNKKLEDIIEYIQCDSFSLKAHEPVSVSKDGEISAFTSGQFELLHKKLNLVLPAGSELIY